MPSLRKVLIALCIAFPLLSFVLSMLAWLTHGIDIPYMDDWRQYFWHEAGSFAPATLFRPSNDTLYPIGMAMDAAAVRWLGGNAVAYQTISMFVVLLSILGMQWLLLKHVLKNAVLAASAFCFSLLMLQPESYWGLQNMAFHQAIPLVCVLGALHSIIVSRISQRWMGGVVLLLGLISGMTYISGAFSYLACGIALVLQSWLWKGPVGARQRAGGISMALAGILTSIPQAWVIVFYQKGTHRADAPLALPYESDFWFYLFGKIGRSLLLPVDHPAFSLAISLTALIALVVVLVLAYRAGRSQVAPGEQQVAYSDGFAMLIALSATVATYLVLVAAGRANLRDPSMVANLEIFSFAYLRFHFFWVTLLWPWVAGLGLAWICGRREGARNWLPFAAAASVVLWTACGNGFGHMDSQRLLAAKRADGVACIRREANLMHPIMCESIELRDLRPALEYAEDVNASFSWDVRSSAQTYTPGNSAVNVPLNIGPGDQLDGEFVAVHSGSVTSVAVKIGNYQGTADGKLDISVCNKRQCSTGSADLYGTSDNNYLEVRIPVGIRVEQDGILRFRIASRDATSPFAVWLNPSTEGAARILRVHSSATGMDRSVPGQTLKLSVWYRK